MTQPNPRPPVRGAPTDPRSGTHPDGPRGREGPTAPSSPPARHPWRHVNRGMNRSRRVGTERRRSTTLTTRGTPQGTADHPRHPLENGARPATPTGPAPERRGVSDCPDGRDDGRTTEGAVQRGPHRPRDPSSGDYNGNRAPAGLTANPGNRFEDRNDSGRHDPPAPTTGQPRHRETPNAQEVSPHILTTG